MKIKPMPRFLKRILPPDTIGISLCPFGIYIDQEHDSPVLRNHEMIHWKQQVEMLIIFFYVWYGVEMLFKHYAEVSFEQEAYFFETTPDYAEHRKPFAWVDFIL